MEAGTAFEAILRYAQHEGGVSLFNKHHAWATTRVPNFHTSEVNSFLTWMMQVR